MPSKSENPAPIDIDDYERSRDIIQHHLGNNEYQDRLPYIQEARRRVLEEMNIFAVIDRHVSSHGESTAAAGSGGVIRNRSTMRIKNPVAGIRSLWEKGYVKMRHRLLAQRSRQ